MFMTAIGPVVRILIRYLAGAGFGGAASAALLSDPEFTEVAIMAVSALAGIGVELWYRLAKRYGWAT